MTNEPTTVNIAKALRVCFEKTCACSECPFEHESCGNIEQLAADRLETQARTIAALTARAESAEKWAAAAIADIERLRLKKFTLCPICEFEDIIGCAHKNHCIGYQQFKWRGTPQDGGDV